MWKVPDGSPHCFKFPHQQIFAASEKKEQQAGGSGCVNYGSVIIYSKVSIGVAATLLNSSIRKKTAQMVALARISSMELVQVGFMTPVLFESQHHSDFFFDTDICNYSNVVHI